MNRRFKDSVFTALFSDKESLLELYNAVQGTNFGPDADLEINTLEGALYTERQNDISFLLNGRFVVLIEHQSTICDNMPIRMLLYVARVYEKILTGDNLYRQKRIPIPTPEFIVLYNGEVPFPEEQELCLSDAFLEKQEPVNLELTVKVVNINYGKSHEVLDRSKTLEGYSQFVYTVRRYMNKGLSPEDAIEQAIDDCIKQGILTKFLNENGSEVRNMLFQEWNLDEALKIRHEEGIEEGIEKGQVDIIRSLHKSGMDIETIIKITSIPKEKVQKYLS